jgi:hypothetical protein
MDVSCTTKTANSKRLLRSASASCPGIVNCLSHSVAGLRNFFAYSPQLTIVAGKDQDQDQDKDKK